MRKLLILPVFILCFFLSATLVNASLIVVDKEGEIVWKVLSSNDSLSLGIPQRDYLEVKDITAGVISADAKVSLTKKDGKISLTIVTEQGEKSLDVSDWQDELIEIEERGEAQRLVIGILGDKFSLRQKGVLAVTEFPINIDPALAELSLSTPSGRRYLTLLPLEAVETALRAKVINRLPQGENLQITEETGGELAYLITGERVINLFNFFEYVVPVRTKVSALTGEILSVEQPTWLRIFGFLFV